MYKKLYYLIITVLYLLMIGLALVAYLIYYNVKDLPNYSQLADYNPPLVTTFYSKDGKLLEQYAKEHRVFIPIEAIPVKVRGAFLAVEDKNFYSHPGIDVSSLIRAVVQNIVNFSHNKKNLVGGSTITQQVVKNFLLGNEKTINRKIKEAILSFRITKIYSKDRILELYLNQIFFGQGAYGISSAASIYFNKSVQELTLEEMAFLASLPKAPSAFNPAKNYKRALERRNWAIERMVEEGYTTKKEAEIAVEKPIQIIHRDISTLVSADFFAENVRKKMIDAYGSDAFYQNGYNVITTLDSNLQKIAEKSFKHGLILYDQRKGYRGAYSRIKDLKEWRKDLSQLSKDSQILKEWKLATILKIHKDYLQIGLVNEEGFIKKSDTDWALKGNKNLEKIFKVGDVITVEAKQKNFYFLRQTPRVNGGLVVMEVGTGRVLALVGGFNPKNTKFDRATQALRQPGSVFKPFVYLTAFANGFSPISIVNDSPIEIYQGPGLPMWRPKNYYNDFLGPITLRRGFELSRNTITVNLARLVGLKKIKETTRNFGINTTANSGYAMVLGSMETTLLNITNAYNMIASGGKKLYPIFIEKIQRPNGSIVYGNEPTSCQNCNISSKDSYKIPSSEEDLPQIVENTEQVIDPRFAYQMISLMEGVVQHTLNGRSIKNLGKTLAGKTGTTNNSLDTWFIGFSPELIVGTYVGHDHPETLGAKETGATVALPIFVEFMKNALHDRPDLPFSVPSGIKFTKVDYYTGKAANLDSEQTIYEALISDNKDNELEEDETEEIEEDKTEEDNMKESENNDESLQHIIIPVED